MGALNDILRNIALLRAVVFRPFVLVARFDAKVHVRELKKTA